MLNIYILFYCTSLAIATKCCSSVQINTTGISLDSQCDRLATYHQLGNYKGRPAYQHERSDEYLYYSPAPARIGRNIGHWIVGTEIGNAVGGISILSNDICPEDVLGEWKFSNGLKWDIDPHLQLECVDDESGTIPQI